VTGRNDSHNYSGLFARKTGVWREKESGERLLGKENILDVWKKRRTIERKTPKQFHMVWQWILIYAQFQECEV
jgi:hypothetical protein